MHTHESSSVVVSLQNSFRRPSMTMSPKFRGEWEKNDNRQQRKTSNCATCTVKWLVTMYDTHIVMLDHFLQLLVWNLTFQLFLKWFQRINPSLWNTKLSHKTLKIREVTRKHTIVRMSVSCCTCMILTGYSTKHKHTHVICTNTMCTTDVHTHIHTYTRPLQAQL